jgi:hypothetical protein
MHIRNRALSAHALLLLLTLFACVACSSGNSTNSQEFAAKPAPVVVQQAESVSIAAVGDIMLGSTNPPDRGLPLEDGAKLLVDAAPILSAADIAFGNLEGPMLEGGTSAKCGPKSRMCYAFRVPTRYGKHLKDAGFDVMSVANNHASDFGLEGRVSTEKVLDELGILHSGSNRNDFAYLNVKGRKIIVISFATNEVSYNLNDIATAKSVVSRMSKGQDIVVVSFHGGAEGVAAQNVPRGAETFLGAPRGDLRAFTHAVVDAGADLVLGHGPHVVRGMEVYKNRLIAYSLGNSAFYRFPFKGPTALSLVLEVNLAPDGAFKDGLIHPLYQEGQNGPRVDKTKAVISTVRQLSVTDFGASAVKVGDDGKLTAP